MSGTKPFQLGLVMAGAVSAGAYTAGVVDYLIAALDHWEHAKREDARRGGPLTVPRHDVMIQTMTGASAGAITAAITSAALFAEHRPVLNAAAPPPPRNNRLYDCWVEQIDIAKLLGTADLDRFGQVVSLLDSSILAEIGQSALTVDRLAASPRSYIADPLAVFLTVSNLRGVPYAFSLFGEKERRYGMNAHMDTLRFAISENLGAQKPAFSIDGMQSLDPVALFEPGHSGRPAWDQLVTAALASGAFPIGLEPRTIERPGADYQAQPYSLIGSQPGWEEEPWVYRFVAVDGGLMSNEPMSLAHAFLRSETGQRRSEVELRLEQSGHRAPGALVLIDPFPNEIEYHREYWPAKSLVSVFGQMFSALKSQARFNAEELELAANPDVYNRFAIAPSRVDATGAAREPAIASAIMGGFGGFLSRSFRRHDFHLGRRNCQAFLARHFSLPETNPVFSEDNFPTALREAYYLRDREGRRIEVSVPKGSGRGTEKRPLLPIIPLLSPLDTSPPTPPWPHATDIDLVDLGRGVARRVEEAGAVMIETELRPMLGPVTAWAAKRAWRNVLASRVTAAIMRAIERELGRLG